MADFSLWHVNRLVFPMRWVLVCEDDLDQQILLLGFFRKRYGTQGEVLPIIVGSGVPGLGVYRSMKGIIEPMAVMLDHDMPFGNGAELTVALRADGYKGPIIAMSSLAPNNAKMISLGATNVTAQQKGVDPSLPKFFDILDAQVKKGNP